jgi:nucleotide-binding universal stress UspA family protein
LPILAIIFQILLVLNLHTVSRTAIIIGPVWVLLGILVYNVYSKKHAITTEDEIRILEDEKVAISDNETNYRILVPVANPDNALSLVKTTYKISNAKNAEVNLLHMVRVPDQVPLSDAERYMLVGKEAIVEIMLYLAPLFPVNTTIRYCRNIARGIVSAIREKHTNMLIIGWHGKIKNREYSLGSTLDPVIERSPCDVVILKDCGNLSAKRILVPIAGGPNCGFALEIAHILADSIDSEIVAFNVAGGKHTTDLNALVNHTEKSHNIPEGRFEIKIKRHQDVIQTILNEAKNYDLVVVGATEQSIINQFFNPSIPEALAEKCQKPFVMVKAASGIRSWVKWWV